MQQLISIFFISFSNFFVFVFFYPLFESSLFDLLFLQSIESSSFLSMFKPPKFSFHNFLYYRCYFNLLSNIIISYFITSSLTIHLMQHPRLCYIYFIFVSIFNCQTFCLVQHRSYYRCPIKKIHQLEWYFCSISVTQFELHDLHPLSISPSFCIMDRYLNHVTCGMVCSSTYISKLKTLLILLNMHSIYSVTSAQEKIMHF